MDNLPSKVLVASIVGAAFVGIILNARPSPEQVAEQQRLAAMTPQQRKCYQDAAAAGGWLSGDRFCAATPAQRDCYTGYRQTGYDDFAATLNCDLDPVKHRLREEIERQEAAQQQRQMDMANERVGEATRNLRRVCAEDPNYAARNPVTCSQ